MLPVALLIVSSLSPPVVTRRGLIASAAAAPFLMQHPIAHAASWQALKADGKEVKMEQREERELIDEMRKIVRVEEEEEAQLQRIRDAQRNRLALVTNRESPAKLAFTLKEESNEVEADKQELAFVRAEYKEVDRDLQKQRQRVDDDRAALLGLRR